MEMIEIDERQDYWAIALNRPEKLNALCAPLVEALIEAFEAAQRQHVPLVALYGRGRCFSAGFDMSDLPKQSDGDLLLRFVRIEMLLNMIAASPCVTFAFAHGGNFGAGVDLMAACDIRVAAPGSTFRMPGLKFGLVLGTARFARIVGTQEARRILGGSLSFGIERALQNGFIEKTIERDQLEPAIQASADSLNCLPVTSRCLLQHALDTEHADTELAALVRSAATPGLRDRILAYLETTASAGRAGVIGAPR